ncbi:NAD-dependent epimerase/dehydratase family protein [Microtetraspora glauca]|uniref:NAD-dependent epimerase/dehydratase family protein n=1 Tax=Microtetraspora glauca TaxID=1996 RepID=A0ABV3G6E2_MICGL
MKVLVIGATGYIGAAVAERLAGDGHEVVALVRDPAGSGLTGDVRRGDLREPESLIGAVTPDVDAVIHAASPTGDERVDVAAVRALISTGKPLVYTSGVWVLGRTGEPATEEAPVDPLPLVGYRPAVERIVLDGGGFVIRPGIVHGYGRGIPALLAAQAAEYGLGRYVHAGGPPPVWPTVHVADLADLYPLVLERARPGDLFHAVAEEGVPVSTIAEAAARAAGTPCARAVPWPVEQAAEVLGRPFADALALSQRVSGARARRELGWTPSRPGIVEDLAAGATEDALSEIGAGGTP